MAPAPAANPSFPALLRYFLGLGLRAFGGLGAVLALLTRDLVGRRAWLRETDVTEALTYTKLLPGSTVVQVVAYLGWRLRGWPGAALATAGFLLPAFALMVALAAGYQHVAALAGVPAALRGLTAAVAGVLLVTAWTLGKKPLTSTAGRVVAALALLASVVGQVTPALLVLAAGAWGVAREARSPAKTEKPDPRA